MLIGTSGQQDEVTGTFWMEPPLIFLIFLFLSTSLFFLCPQWCKAVMLGLSVYSSLVCGLYVPINLGKNLNHRCTFICGTEGVNVYYSLQCAVHEAKQRKHEVLVDRSHKHYVIL
jgi:hypothetical protein